MSAQRLDLALELLRPAHAGRFEEFASEFLVEEFANLRVMASPSGDRGRDAELWEPSDDAAVKLQYSVATDWRAKITKTAKRLADSFADTKILIYVTNQAIGAKADDLKSELRRSAKISLDIRDRSFFLGRWDKSVRLEAAAERLCVEIVEPVLAKRGISRKAQPLTDTEAKAALVYLTLQREDDTQDKGLTKMAFDALVRAALRDTNPDSRLSRDAVHRFVMRSISSHEADAVQRYTDSALKRLDKRFLRHYRSSDEFCLTKDERDRLARRVSDLAVEELEIEREISGVLANVARDVEPCIQQARVKALVASTQQLIENFLYRRGEAFVATVMDGTSAGLELSNLEDVVAGLVAKGGPWKKVSGEEVSCVLHAAQQLMLDPPEPLARHYQSLSASYTVYAFLRETPDVQTAVTKMFSGGELWLDSNIILRLFAEELSEDQIPNGYKNILAAARKAGLSLSVTDGVIEEVEAHTFLSLKYARQASGDPPWRGNVPFLYAAFALAGGERGDFAVWVEQYRGDLRPREDILEYLSEAYGIELGTLEEHADRAPIEVRGLVKEFWYDVHERRNAGFGRDVEPERVDRMVRHDVESYLGVLYKRQRKRDSAFGYSTWWLTLDSAAYKLASKIGLDRKWPGQFMPPTISPDFLTTYLAVGPARERLARGDAATLPLMVDLAQLDVVSEEFLERAESVRKELVGLPKRVIQRRVRDELDRARIRMGPRAREGLSGAIKGLKQESEVQR